MYNVLLVDDDVAVLEFLSKKIPWNEWGFQLAGTYTNAHDAIESWERTIPELIITDIGMPEMDGLELIKKLQTEASKTRYVILSCHDDFRYAQQAVQLGVQDYMLKETLSVEGMRRIAQRVRDKIDEDNRLKSEVERLNYRALKSQSVWKEQWLRSLLSNPVLDDRILLEQLREYGLAPAVGHFIPVCFRIYSFHDAIFRYGKEEIVKFIVENAAEELLQGEPEVMFFSYSTQEFFLLIACRNDLSLNPYDKLTQLSRNLQQAIAKFLKLEFSVLVGEMAADFAGIKRQLPELLLTADVFFYHDAPVIMKRREVEVPKHQEDPFLHVSEYAGRLHDLLLEEDGDVKAVVDSFIQFIKAHQYHPAEVKQLVWKLALDLQLKLNFSQQFDKEKNQHVIAQMVNVNELRNWLLQFMGEAVTRAAQIAKKSKKSEIVDAQKYVNLYLNRRITLEEVACHLHLNPSYFSRLYKKETGENFIEYVTRMKMEKAKALLIETDNTVEKVSLMLGYDNKSYFIKLFKQHFGVVPSRFI